MPEFLVHLIMKNELIFKMMMHRIIVSGKKMTTVRPRILLMCAQVTRIYCPNVKFLFLL